MLDINWVILRTWLVDWYVSRLFPLLQSVILGMSCKPKIHPENCRAVHQPTMHPDEPHNYNTLPTLDADCFPSRATGQRRAPLVTQRTIISRP